MKLARLCGWTGFLIGLLGPILFYGVNWEWACLTCPHITVAPGLNPLSASLPFDLLQAIIFAVIGYAGGYFVSKTNVDKA